MPSIPETQSKIKWEEKKKESLAVAERMKKHKHLFTRAARMEQCGDLVYFSWCPQCGHTHAVSGGLCRDRLCPLCGWRLSLARYSQMMGVLDSMDEDFTALDIHCSFMTLTVKNVKLQNLSATLKAFSKAWYHISNLKCIKDLYGWARAYEITYNSATNTYHPHVHLLLFWRGKPDTTARFNLKMVKHWSKQLGLSYTPIWQHEQAYIKADTKDIKVTEDVVSWREDTRQAAKQAAVEASKYTFGDKLVLDVPESDLPALADQIKGVRMVAYGGQIKERRKLLNMSDEDYADDVHTKVCPTCGTEMQQAVLQWAAGHYISASQKGGE